MSTEQNKSRSRRFFEEVWGKGNIAVIDELTAPNFVDHNAAPGLRPDWKASAVFRDVPVPFLTCRSASMT